ncbi:hypothetical protein [Roseicella aquatilis]|uniref:Uncharacterized protein n=1 Tax=Roseicella aquatilis TaxID=2527868 RepID=A0A4V2WLJ9_9PROT|nr:hypothetical protein [Roseicella aquatilis]TCZ63040.1 hypothetical protein EXY23_11770 [Roseicella aquatilis]
MDKPRYPQPRPSLGPWPDGPWWLLGAASVAAPVAVLCQGGSLHVAILASLACLATPGAAIEAMGCLARLALAVVPPPRS